MKKKQDLSAFLIVFLIIGLAAASFGSKEEDHSNAPEPTLLTEEQKAANKQNGPAMTPVPDSDGIGSTNLAEDERKEVRAENPTPQALPQPIAETLEGVEAESNTSKYKGLIEIRNSSGPKKTDVNQEHIYLSAKSNNTESINISKWKIRSAVSGRIVDIGNAERLFISGSTGSKEIVVMGPKDKVYILSGRSPIGSSFVVNKCMGYLKQFSQQTVHCQKMRFYTTKKILLYLLIMRAWTM